LSYVSQNMASCIVTVKFLNPDIETIGYSTWDGTNALSRIGNQTSYQQFLNT